MNEEIIKLNDVSKIYKGKKALDRINLNLKKGEIYGLVGENGAGKTTIIKAILGLIECDSGSVEIFGETSYEGLNLGRRSIGSMVETPSFFPYLSGRKNLEYYRIQRGIENKAVVDEVMDLVGLNSYDGNRKFQNFSLGMKQRLGLAHALMANPDVLILDEPINGLDPQGTIDFRRFILKLNKEKGITVLISMHTLDELYQIATSYGFISKGKVLREITKEELDRQSRKYIRINIEELERATVVLEQDLKTLNYEIDNNRDILLYDYVDQTEEVLRALVAKNLYPKSIYSEGIKLEDYYMDLMEGNKDA